MIVTEKAINDLNVAKIMLCNPQAITPEMCVKIGQAISSAIALLKEQKEKICSVKEIALDESTNAAWRKDFEAWKVLDRIVQKLS